MKLEQVIRNVFNLDHGIEILDNYGPGDLNEWDSLGHLSLMTEIESVYKISVSIDEMMKLQSVKDIKNFLKNKNVTSF